MCFLFPATDRRHTAVPHICRGYFLAPAPVSNPYPPAPSNIAAAFTARWSGAMANLPYLLLGVAGFIGLALYVRFCNRL